MEILTFNEIYERFQEKHDGDLTLNNLIDIFVEENSWIGTPFQLMKIKELSYLITGIRVGQCSGCAIDCLINMDRWINNYIKNLPKRDIIENIIEERQNANKGITNNPTVKKKRRRSGGR